MLRLDRGSGTRLQASSSEAKGSVNALISIRGRFEWRSCTTLKEDGMRSAYVVLCVKAKN